MRPTSLGSFPKGPPQAGPGEILVSRTVKDLVVGSDTGFEDRGLHTLKGFEGDWQLYSVTVGGTP